MPPENDPKGQEDLAVDGLVQDNPRPRRRRETDAQRKLREENELQEAILETQRKAELAEMVHASKKAGLFKLQMLRTLAWVSVVLFMLIVLVIVGVFLYFAIKQGVLNDAGLLTGVIGTLKDVIGILVGL